MPKRKLYGAAKKAHQRKLKRERDRRYRERNREKIRERDRQYRIKYPYSQRKARRELRRLRDLEGKFIFKEPTEEVLTLIYIGYPH